MKTFTTIGYWEDAPHEPICFVVDALDVRSAIKEAERCAQATLECQGGRLFINTFVLAGKPEVLSTWAG